MPGMFGGMGNSPMQQMEMLSNLVGAATAAQQQLKKEEGKRRKALGRLG